MVPPEATGRRSTGAARRALASARTGRVPDAADLAKLPEGLARALVAMAAGPTTAPRPEAPVTQSRDVTQSVGVTQEIQETKDTEDKHEPPPAAAPSPTSKGNQSRGRRTRTASRERPQRPLTAKELMRAVVLAARQVTAAPPPGKGSLVFKLVRRLKAAPELRGRPFAEVLRMLQTAWPRWWAKYSDGREGQEDIVDAFAYAWEHTRLPEGHDPLRFAVERAAHEPLTVLGEYAEVPTFAPFLGVVKHLAEYQASASPTVLLPVWRLEYELGFAAMSMSRCIERAEKLGIVMLVREAVRGHRAAEFKVDLARLRELTRPADPVDAEQASPGKNRRARRRTRDVEAR